MSSDEDRQGQSPRLPSVAGAVDLDGAHTGRASLLEPESGSLRRSLALLHHEIFLRPTEKQQRHRWEWYCPDGACFPQEFVKGTGNFTRLYRHSRTMCQLIRKSLGFGVRLEHAQGGQWMVRGPTHLPPQPTPTVFTTHDPARSQVPGSYICHNPPCTKASLSLPLKPWEASLNLHEQPP